MNHTDDKKYWVAFSRIDNLGPQKFKLLLAYFPDLATAWQANFGDLRRAGLLQKDIEKILEQRVKIDPDEEQDRLKKLGLKVVTLKEKEYPKPLKEIYSPPAVLYIKGTLPADWDFALAVVGTRKTSNYGRQITPDIVMELSRSGLIIVSGLALGIDALAHQSALDAGGLTVAVLGCGLDCTYPISNRSLAEKIVAQGGCLVSEYPLGTQPLKQHFPARNRIISGLSRGVLVIEGNKDSGSLITAKCALDQNREILAVPGNISSQTSQGPNNLIKIGAYVVTSGQDVLYSMAWDSIKQKQDNKKIIPATYEEEIILQFLSLEPLHIDEIIQRCKLNTSIINATLTMMEMKGLVRHLGGQNYILSH